MHVGVADHLGWDATVTTSADQEVLDRRRIERCSTDPRARLGPPWTRDHRTAVAATVVAAAVRG